MIKIKSATQIEQMKKAGALSKMALRHVGAMVRPGVSTFELDQLAEQIIRMHGGTPAFKGYGGFPGTICASINDAVVHGIPNPDMILRDGDIISIDCGTLLDGFNGDSCYTFCVGEVSDEIKQLLSTTKEALYKGIENAVAGRHLGDIGSAVQDHCEKKGYGVVRELTGHGIGREMHEDPQVPNYGRRGNGILLKSGMCLAIEPMITMGDRKIAMLPDHWSICTRDGKPAAHFEHTLAVRNGKAEVLSSFSEIEKLEANY